MRLFLGPAILALALPGALAAQPFPAIPGFNVGINPNAAVQLTFHNGMPALWVLVPGNEPIVSFHDPAMLPPLTQKVRFAIAAWTVYEPQPCAPGAFLFFDTQNPLSLTPHAQLPGTGWSWFGPSITLGRTGDSFHSTWELSYCSVVACTSPCGFRHRDPVLEAFLFVPSTYQ